MDFLMEFSTNFPFFCILITIAGGVVCSVLRPTAAYRLNLAIATICFIMSGLLLYTMYIEPRQITFMMGHFSAPWGNEIRFGPLEALMATVFSLVVILSSLAEKPQVFNKIHQSKTNLFYLMMCLLLASTYALVYTNDLFTAYVFIEINTLCSCGFVAAKNSRKAIAATIKYLIMSLLGSGLFLISISLLYILTGHLLMPNVQEAVAAMLETSGYSLPLTLIVGLMAVSMAIKSALYPFHTWVPVAYNRAFNLSNALSSGLVLKGYIILLIKIFYRVLGLEIVKELEILNILLLFGLLSMVLASIDAVKEGNIKKMLACSSVAQVGYVYVAIGIGTQLSFAAAAYLIIGHSVAKSMLYTACEGLMQTSDNTKFITLLQGSALRNPWAGLPFTLGALSMIGFPLLPGFFGKYLLVWAAIDSSPFLWVILLALIASTVLNAMYFLRCILVIWTKGTAPETVYAPPKSFKFVMVAFMAVNLALGLGYGVVYQLITQGLTLL